MSQLDALAADYASQSAIAATRAQLREARTRLDTLARVCKQLEPLAADSAGEEGEGRGRGSTVHVPLAPRAFLAARTTGARIRISVPSKATDGENRKGKEREGNEQSVDSNTALEMLRLRRKGESSVCRRT